MQPTTQNSRVVTVKQAQRTNPAGNADPTHSDDKPVQTLQHFLSSYTHL